MNNIISETMLIWFWSFHFDPFIRFWSFHSPFIFACHRTLSADGVLTIKAPKESKAIEGGKNEKDVPIERSPFPAVATAAQKHHKKDQQQQGMVNGDKPMMKGQKQGGERDVPMKQEQQMKQWELHGMEHRSLVSLPSAFRMWLVEFVRGVRHTRRSVLVRSVSAGFEIDLS